MSNPSSFELIVPKPNNTFPATDDLGVINNSGFPEKAMGNVTCFDVCSFGLGVMVMLPYCSLIPPKAEFSKRNQEFLPEYTLPGVL